MPYAPLTLTPALYDYVNTHTGPEPPLLSALRAHVVAHHPQHHMVTPWPTAQLLAFLVRLTRPRTLVEVGTFVGYSTLALAMAMGADAHLHTIDHDTTPLDMGRPFWNQSGQATQISVHKGDGVDQLQKLHNNGTIGDFFYIDANKKGYEAYLDAALRMAAPGALLAFDNTLSEGQVVHQNPKPFVKAIQAFNQKVRQQAQQTPNPAPFGTVSQETTPPERSLDAPHSGAPLSDLGAPPSESAAGVTWPHPSPAHQPVSKGTPSADTPDPAPFHLCLLPIGDGLTLIQKTE